MVESSAISTRVEVVVKAKTENVEAFLVVQKME